jgi:hypothetical protein
MLQYKIFNSNDNGTHTHINIGRNHRNKEKPSNGQINNTVDN